LARQVERFAGIERQRIALVVALAGGDRPAPGDDRQDRAERADVHVNPGDAFLLQLLALLPRDLLDAALQVVPPYRFSGRPAAADGVRLLDGSRRAYECSCAR